MDVQNISGGDVVVREFTPEYTPRNENAPQERNSAEIRSDRPAEPNKGNNIDAMA